MIENFAKRYSYDGEMFQEIGKRGPKVKLTKKDMASKLLEFYDITDVPEKILQLINLCKPVVEFHSEGSTEDITERIQGILDSQDFIKDFRYLKINNAYFTYLLEGNRANYIQVGFPNTKSWIEVLMTYKNAEICDLQSSLAPLLRPKTPYSVTMEQIAELVANKLKFSKRQDLQEDLLGDIKPVTLSTSSEISLYKAPYHYIEKPQLGEMMHEFLQRVSDHEHLCAIIWVTFNGIKSPYVVYLHGTGGEGKSSFLNVLCEQVGSYASFSDHDKFSNYGMYNKAIITLTENTNGQLLQNKVVKQLTGGSFVHCEQKNKGVFSAQLQGTLYVDSNRMLSLKGEEAEFRRLRLFRVSKPTYLHQIDAATYTARLKERFVDFLNYCRICFEKVGSKTGWLVPPSTQQTADFNTFLDKEFIYNSETVLRKIIKDLNLVYDKDGKFKSSSFWSVFFKYNDGKNKYAMHNLKDYLFLHKGVAETGEYLYGLSQKESENTSFELPNNV